MQVEDHSRCQSRQLGDGEGDGDVNQMLAAKDEALKNEEPRSLNCRRPTTTLSIPLCQAT